MSRISYKFKIPSRLNDAFRQLDELPLGIAVKCVEEGARLLADDVNAALNEEGDGVEITIRFDRRFGELAAHLDALSTRTDRSIEELLPSIFAAGFAEMEPAYRDIIKKRLVHAQTSGQSSLVKGKGSSEVN